VALARILLSAVALLGVTAPLFAGWLGVTVVGLAEEEPGAVGTLHIDEVVEGGPAHKAGILVGDRVLAFAGTPVKGCAALSAAVQAAKPGQRVEIKVLRDGKALALPVVLSDKPRGTPETEVKVIGPPPIPMPEWQSKMKRGFLGVRLIPISKGLGQYFEVANGALIAEVIPGTPAEKAGLHAGDVIQRIDSKEIQSPADVGNEISQHKKGDAVTLVVARDGKTLRLRAALDEKESEAIFFSPSTEALQSWYGKSSEMDPEAYRHALEDYKKALQQYLQDAKINKDAYAKALAEYEKALQILAEDSTLRDTLKEHAEGLQRTLEKAEQAKIKRYTEQQSLEERKRALDERERALEERERALKARERALEQSP
jgi:membrane-associated protease RseP (regulator of RpoE activity)